MALFPAFAAEACDSNVGKETVTKGLDWLSNQSFRNEDPLTLHQLSIKKEEHATQSFSLEQLKEENSEETKIKSKKKKKEKKKKEKKKYKKKAQRHSDSSWSDSDSVDLSGDHLSNYEKCKKEPESARKPEPNAIQSHFLWLDDLQQPTDQYFCIDRKGDPANKEYDSLYRGDIARYKRKGQSCLGLNPKKQCITWSDSTSVKKKNEKKPDRYFSKAASLIIGTEGLMVNYSGNVQSSDPTAFTSDFMEVPGVKEEETTASCAPLWVNPLGIYDASTTLWLQGKGQQKNEDQSIGSQQSGEKINTAMASKVEEFNKKLRENPEDIQAWLEFVNFQDKLMMGPSPFCAAESDLEGRKKSLRFIIEKKISMLDRAIESNPSSVELKLARLELFKELWEPSALLKEWQKLIFLHPNNTELWKKYLLFCQSQFSTFTVSKMNSIYGKCLKTLAAVHDGCMVSHPALPDTEEALLAIFLQQCHFLRQAGHSEKVISLFQAMIEFTFFKPDSVKDLPTKQQVEFFEPFWDCGEPRFGETGARGWRAWMHQQERGGWIIPNETADEDASGDEDDDNELKDKTWPKWKIWLNVECSREVKHWLPWKPDKSKGQTEEDCEDPERQVLFDDIGPSMIRISKPDLVFQMVTSFLQFMGLPVGSNFCSPYWSILLDEMSAVGCGLEENSPLTSMETQCNGIGCVGHIYTFNSVKQEIIHHKFGEQFVHNVLLQVLPLFPKKEKSLLSLYWLQYEKYKVIQHRQKQNKKQLKSQGKKSKKLAKNLLKESENRNNLALWKEYAHLEWLLGNKEEARKVFDTSVTVAISLGLEDTDLCSLCLLYAQLEVEASEGDVVGVTSQALHILTKLTDGGPYVTYSGQVAPVAILKARKVYEHAVLSILTNISSQNTSTSSSDFRPDTLTSLIGCFALFQYITVGLEASDKIFEHALEVLSHVPSQLSVEISPNKWTQPNEMEKLTLMRALHLRYHMKISNFPLKTLREMLIDALKLFPGNHRLWKLYVEVENKYHNASRSRRFFDNVAKNTKYITPCLFAVFAEQKRKEMIDHVQRVGDSVIYLTVPENGLSNRIRVLFEHAVCSENGAHCPLMWRMYLSFMVVQGNKERSRGVFYRALQSCPWTKALYLDAIEYFPDHFNEVIDLIVEKELRLRIPLEEVDLLLED
ncbi:nuclear exosome regulator NRDE2 [Erpetoichthys calabaricus]|uniref:nuclear exosome regulator NRDE2 n=1 Tax=Erpetoichthys calabaricus TaxID=27687 RepID=UPI0022349C4E|nr:nuclear exosome regulator NRDE2 [Erpetoichthys calabaricus]